MLGFDTPFVLCIENGEIGRNVPTSDRYHYYCCFILLRIKINNVQL